MAATAEQRRHAEARRRALERQAFRAKEAIPEGFRLAPAGPRAVPMLRYTFDQLAHVLDTPGLAGFVLAASCRTKCWIYGASYPRSATTNAWQADAYRCKPGDRIELSAEGRASGLFSTVKLFPFVATGAAPEPLKVLELDSNGLPSTELPPWEPLPNHP